MTNCITCDLCGAEENYSGLPAQIPDRLRQSWRKVTVETINKSEVVQSLDVCEACSRSLALEVDRAIKEDKRKPAKRGARR